MKELYLSFIEWTKNVGLSEILNYLVVLFNAIFVPIATHIVKNAKVKTIDAVAKNKELTSAIKESQTKVDKEVAELKKEISILKQQGEESIATIERLGGIIALLIQQAKTNGNAKDYALKLFSIPTEKVNVKKENSSEVVKDIVKEVEKEVHEQAVKEQKGQYDSLVDELINHYE